MVRPQALVFDWDNTLVDSWVCIQAAINATLRAMGHREWDMAETMERSALSLRDSFPAVFGERWIEAREIFYRTFESIHYQYLKPIPGVPAMLDSFAALGLPMAVVSNKNGRYLREEAHHLGWDERFSRLVGANDASQDKPAAEPVRLVCQAMGVTVGPAVWFIGDAPVDMECALNADCTPILVRIKEPSELGFISSPPRRHLHDSTALTALVSELLIPISTD